MDEPPPTLLTRNEFLLLVFTLVSAGAITQARAAYYVYGVGGFGDSWYGGTLL